MILGGALLLAAVSSSAQLNVQLHYDLGRACYGSDLDNRQRLTATVENFTADKWGSTYFFVDADFGDQSMRGAYTEISRELQFWKFPLAFHVEYNGGLSYGSGKGDGYAFNNAYLGGLAYNWNSADFTKGVSVQLMYKYLAKYGAYTNSWQLTGVWLNTFANGICTFSGFADLWYDNTVSGNLIFLTEPQFWVNLYALKRVSDDFKLSVGTEVEISTNFVYSSTGAHDRFYALPTLACKWTF